MQIATGNERWEKVVPAAGVLQQAMQLELERVKELEVRLGLMAEIKAFG